MGAIYGRDPTPQGVTPKQSPAAAPTVAPKSPPTAGATNWGNRDGQHWGRLTDDPNAEIWRAGLQSGAPAPGTNVDARRFQDPSLAGNLATIDKMRNDALARQAPTMPGATIEQSGMADWRQRQMALIGQLEAQSRGLGGPTAAQSQLDSDIGAAVRMQQALAATQGGTAQAQRAAGFASAEAQQMGAQQMTQLRAQEQVAARQRLAEVLSGVRGSDMDAAITQAGYTQAARQQNLTSQLDTQNQIDAMVQYYTSSGLSLEQAQAEAWRQYDKLRVNAEAQDLGLRRGLDVAGQNLNSQIGGAAISTLGALAAQGVRSAGGG